MYKVRLQCGHTKVIVVRGTPTKGAMFGIECDRSDCPNPGLAFYNATLLRPVECQNLNVTMLPAR